MLTKELIAYCIPNYEHRQLVFQGTRAFQYTTGMAIGFFLLTMKRAHELLA